MCTDRPCFRVNGRLLDTEAAGHICHCADCEASAHSPHPRRCGHGINSLSCTLTLVMQPHPRLAATHQSLLKSNPQVTVGSLSTPGARLRVPTNGLAFQSTRPQRHATALCDSKVAEYTWLRATQPVGQQCHRMPKHEVLVVGFA
jgi:hypothetical protein